MTLAVGLCVPMLFAVLLGISSRWLVRILPPATAVRLIVASSLVAAAASGFVLSVVAFSVIALDGDVAAIGHWSPAVLRALSPVPRWAGVLAAVLVVPLFLAALLRAVKGARQLWRAEVACRRLGPGVDGLVIVDDEAPNAFALQGLRSRTVVSTGMLAALGPQERRVLLAHEASHLRNRHALYRLCVEIAAAANPVLRPAVGAVDLGIERWADEDGAAAVGDRTVAARALTRAAVASQEPPARTQFGAALAMAMSALATRARALLAPAPRRRRSLAALLVAATVSCLTTTVMVAHVTEHQFERARLPAISRTR